MPNKSKVTTSNYLNKNCHFLFRVVCSLVKQLLCLKTGVQRWTYMPTPVQGLQHLDIKKSGICATRVAKCGVLGGEGLGGDPRLSSENIFKRICKVKVIFCILACTEDIKTSAQPSINKSLNQCTSPVKRRRMHYPFLLLLMIIVISSNPCN